MGLLDKLEKNALVLFSENCKFFEHPAFSTEKNSFCFTVRKTLKGFAIGLPCFVSNFPRKVDVVHHPFQFHERQIIEDSASDTVRRMRVTQQPPLDSVIGIPFGSAAQILEGTVFLPGQSE